MTTTEIWTLIIAGATFLTYLGQLVVLILVYRRVIKETDRNAAERQQAIHNAGEMMQAQGKDMERRLKEIPNNNKIGLTIMGVFIAGILLPNLAIFLRLTSIPTQKKY